MRTDALGIPIYSPSDIFDLIYQGNLSELSNLTVEPNSEIINKFNQSAIQFGDITLTEYVDPHISIKDFDTILQQDWLMPSEYKELDIEAWLYTQIPPWDPEHTRVTEELTAFKERNMLDLLRWMKYFVDTCKANNVVWGVGRGSSVASYVLYLIGVHKIDSIKYNLDWQEFLR